MKRRKANGYRSKLMMVSRWPRDPAEPEDCREIKRPHRLAEGIFHRGEGFPLFAIAIDVAHPRQQLIEGTSIVDAAVGMLNAVLRPPSQLF